MRTKNRKKNCTKLNKKEGKFVFTKEKKWENSIFAKAMTANEELCDFPFFLFLEITGRSKCWLPIHKLHINHTIVRMTSREIKFQYSTRAFHFFFQV